MRYKWVALSNTTLAVFMSTLDGSIVIISLPAIFRGIHLDPLAPGNVGYLLWMIMGYLLVQAVFVVSLGRLGDMFGRVKIYNAGFAVFTLASILLSFDPFEGASGALWLIGWRLVQAFGGAMLTANSAAILTDAFPANQRGLALGINQIAGLGGQLIGLVAGGLLAALDWRAVFWVNVPVGVFGTLWAYRKLRDGGVRHAGSIDWWGNLTFAAGLGTLLIAVTAGIHPYGTHTMGWTNPAIAGSLATGVALLAAFVAIESTVREPMFHLGLFRIRAFAAGNAASFAASVARGGLQFMLVIWLQGIWLPLHGYDYSDTPLWAGICLLPMSAGFLLSGPASGFLSDRFGARFFATAGMLVFAASFIGLLLLPVDFPYWTFALLIAASGVGIGMFGAPNTSAIMSSVPATQRGAASGMRSTLQNSGTSLSIGLFFSLMIAGLASSLPATLTEGLRQQGVPYSIARRAGALPPVSSLFAAFLGVNPVRQLLAPSEALSALPVARQRIITGREFFPNLISAPFHKGLIVVFSVAAGLALLSAFASLLRGSRSAHTSNAPNERAAPMALSTLDPKTALVVIDLQRGLLSIPTVLPISEVVARASALAAAFREHGLPVVLVNVTGGAPGRVEQFRTLGELPAGFAEFVPELDRQPGDHVVTKRTWGAFTNTDLDAYLKGLGVTQIVLAGVATSAGVESTARHAHELGFNVALAVDAMTDRSAEAHANSVTLIFPKLGETGTTAEIIELLAKTRVTHKM